MRRLIIILIIIGLVIGGFLFLYKSGLISFEKRTLSENIYPPDNSTFYLYYDLNNLPLENIIDDQEFLSLISYTKKRGEIFSFDKNSFVFLIEAKKGEGEDLLSFLLDGIKKKGGLVKEKRVSSFRIYEVTPASENPLSSYAISQPFFVSNIKDTVLFTTSLDTFKKVIYIKKEESLLNKEEFKRVMEKIPINSKIFGYFTSEPMNIKDGGFYTQFFIDEILLKAFYEKVERKVSAPISETMLRFIKKDSFFVLSVKGLGEFLSNAISTLQKENPLISSFTQGFDILGFLSLFKNEVIFSINDPEKPDFVIISNTEGIRDVEEKIENFKNYLKENFQIPFKKIPYEDTELIVGKTPIPGGNIAISLLSNFLFLGSEESVKNAIISGKTGEGINLDKIVKETSSDVSGNLVSFFIFDVSRLKNEEKIKNISYISYVLTDKRDSSDFTLKIKLEKNKVENNRD